MSAFLRLRSCRAAYSAVTPELSGPKQQAFPRVGLRAGLLLLVALYAWFPEAAGAAGLGPIFPLEGGTRLATRPDGTTFVIYPFHVFRPNPGGVGGGVSDPYVKIGRIEPGVSAVGPFQAIPTDIANSFSVIDPDVAVNAAGGLLAFNDYEAHGGGFPGDFLVGYYLLDALGQPVGVRQDVNSTDSWRTDTIYTHASINPSGQFAIVYHFETDDRALTKVMARLFGSNGTPVGPSFEVNSPGERSFAGVVVVAPDGSSVFAWQSQRFITELGLYVGWEIKTRRFNATGLPLGAPQRVNTTLNVPHDRPAIAMAADGSYAITWTQTSSAADGIYLRRFGASGKPVELETRISPFGDTGSQIAMAQDGRFEVVFRGLDGDGEDVFAQRFLADGTFEGTALWVNEGQAGAPSNPLLGMAADGRFIVKWDTGTNSFARWIPWDASQQPYVTTQPQNPKVAVGGTATFTLSVIGTPPLSYQWRFNDSPLPGATNATLVLSSVTADQAGPYSVAVSNAFGSVTSSNVMLIATNLQNS